MNLFEGLGLTSAENTGWSISSAANFNGKLLSDESKYFAFQAHHRKEETFLHQIHVTEGHLKNVARQYS